MNAETKAGHLSPNLWWNMMMIIVPSLCLVSFLRPVLFFFAEQCMYCCSPAISNIGKGMSYPLLARGFVLTVLYYVTSLLMAYITWHYYMPQKLSELLKEGIIFFQDVVALCCHYNVQSLLCA
jgi:hypothetical protein